MSKFKISREATIKNLAGFFANTKELGIATPEEIFISAGRQGKPKDQNSGWLSNKLYSMSDHGLFVREYERSESGSDRLARIILTEEGKRALAGQIIIAPQIRAQAVPTQSKEVVEEVGLETLETINHLIRLVHLKLPNWEFQLENDRLTFQPKRNI
jgi:hypothetical protein